MQSKDVDAVADAVLTASRVLVAVAARSLSYAPTEITLPQFRVLVLLSTRGVQNASTLAAELDTLPSSVTRLCDRLAAKDLLSRTVASSSRREVDIEITEAGREVVDRVTAARRREIRRIVAAIPPRRRAALVAALEELATAAGEQPRNTWSLGWGG